MHSKQLKQRLDSALELLLADKSLFERAAEKAAKAAGSKYAFASAIGCVAIWALFGPYFQWSDAHQLFINTTTTIITFWMVFLLQNATNREGRAVQVKLDELIRATDKARNDLISIETKADEEIEEIAVTVKENM